VVKFSAEVSTITVVHGRCGVCTISRTQEHLHRPFTLLRNGWKNVDLASSCRRFNHTLRCVESQERLECLSGTIQHMKTSAKIHSECWRTQATIRHSSFGRFHWTFLTTPTRLQVSRQGRDAEQHFVRCCQRCCSRSVTATSVRGCKSITQPFDWEAETLPLS